MNRNMFGELKKSELDAIVDSIKNKLVAYVNDGKKSFLPVHFNHKASHCYI